MISYQSISLHNASLADREAHFRSVQYTAVHPQSSPCVLLQTCNRTELYYGEGDIPDAVARHLFRVASGLESALIGERAVQGQVKDSYQQAAARYRLPAEMHKLFTFALQTGKRVRNETEISQGAVSHSLAALEIIASEGIDLSRSRITIIGVNKLTADILKFLQNKGARMVFLANRSQTKAHQLADPLGIQVYELRDKAQFLPQSDVIISATSAPHTIINKEDLSSLNISPSTLLPPPSTRLLIDLAFPRDIAPDVADLPGVTLYNIRDVEQRVRQNILVRQSEVARAEAIIEEEIRELQATLARRRQYLHAV